MKIIKITSLGCPSCIIINNIMDDLTNKYNLNITELDYDFDDIEEYNVGTVLPVIIFTDSNGNELDRLVGEHSKKEIIEKIEKYR